MSRARPGSPAVLASAYGRVRFFDQTEPVGFHYRAFLLDGASAFPALDERVAGDGEVDLDRWAQLLRETDDSLSPVGREFLGVNYQSIESVLERYYHDDDVDLRLDEWLLCTLAAWVEPAPSIPGRAVGLGIFDAFLVSQGWPADAIRTLTGRDNVVGLVEAFASLTIRTAVLTSFELVDTGWIPVDFSQSTVARVADLEGVAFKAISYDSFLRVRSDTDFPRTWFATYSPNFQHCSMRPSPSPAPCWKRPSRRTSR